MSVTAVLGAQWGDEGKGKIVDYLSSSSDLVIRFQGGDNAGHTVINEYGEFKLHLVPSGIFNSNTSCLIGTGVVVNPVSLKKELDSLRSSSIDVSRLYISDKAHLVMPYHIALDKAEENFRNNKIGTTQRGIGPAYADKVARWGIQVGEIYNEERFLDRVRIALTRANNMLKHIYGAEELSFDQVISEVWPALCELKSQLVDALDFVHSAINKGSKIMLEGQLGAMRDLDWGTYPYVTSSNPISGGSSVGAGIPPSYIKEVVGVVKAYSTSVGEGPMPSELFDEVGDYLCKIGVEFGATTGRKRRCGWFDAVAVKYSNLLNGFTQLAVTKLDVLSGLSEIRICTGYEIRTETETKVVASVPPSCYMDDAKPVYEIVPGWTGDISNARSLSELPLEAQRYLQLIEKYVGVKISIVSVGPRRDQTIIVS